MAGRNRPFPSYPLPLFQNESSCETIHMKMSYLNVHFHSNQSHFRTTTSFETVAKVASLPGGGLPYESDGDARRLA